MINTHWSSSTSGDISYNVNSSSAADLNIPLLNLTDIYGIQEKMYKNNKDNKNKINRYCKPSCAILEKYDYTETIGGWPKVELIFQLSYPFSQNNYDFGYALEDFANQWLLHQGNYTAEDYLNGKGNIEDMKIKDVQILAENKVVRVVFKDGKTEKAVCNELDEFSLERAIEICICKYLMGGTSNFNKAVRQGLKVYDDKLQAIEDEKAEKERIEKKRAKHNAYRDRCRAKAAQAEKEKQIEIQKEAYLRAMKEYEEEINQEKYRIIQEEYNNNNNN